MSENPAIPSSSDHKPIVETRFRVRFFETDLTWFEEGRSAFTRAIGYPYSRMEQEGLSLAVAEVNVRYHRPAVYDDEVIVSTCLDELQSRGMRFSYQVYRARDRELLAVGVTKHISVDRQGQVRRISDEMRESLLIGIRRLEAGG
jgi:acyl-CoA thioester hydrolase